MGAGCAAGVLGPGGGGNAAGAGVADTCAAAPNGSAEGRGARIDGSASFGISGGPNENDGAEGRCERRDPPSSMGGVLGRAPSLGGLEMVRGVGTVAGGTLAGVDAPDTAAIPCGGVGATAFGGGAAFRRFPQS